MYSAGALVNRYGTNYATLADVQNSLGQELHGISADPLLTDPAHGDFTPEPGSELIDNGVVIPGINDATPDGLPDIGAIERLSDEIFADGFD